jgi:hypothetical protein
MPKPGCWDPKYDQTDTRKEQKRILSAMRSHRGTLLTTAKRIKEHNLEDLIEIAKICCQDNIADFAANQDMITKMLMVLRGAENVQSKLVQ